MEYAYKGPEQTFKSVHLNWHDFCFVYVKISLFLQYRTIVFDCEMILFSVSHSGGIGGTPHLTIFFETPPRTKTDTPPPWAPLLLHPHT